MERKTNNIRLYINKVSKIRPIDYSGDILASYNKKCFDYGGAATLLFWTMVAEVDKSRKMMPTLNGEFRNSV